MFGENGAGKTNLLEAISLLSPGRGLRRAALDLMSAHGEEGVWGVSAVLSGTPSGSDVKIGTAQLSGAPSRRQIKIDDSKASGGDLSKLLSICWLTPQQDRLFTGPSAERRKFIDRMCLAQAPLHGRITNRYEKARQSRGRLLKDGIDDAAWYDGLEREMAQCAAAIAMARIGTEQALQTAIDAAPDDAFPRADVSISGFAEDLARSGAPADDICQAVAENLRIERPTDMRAGRTLSGVHRTELLVGHREKQMAAANCSTGEQKALLIGLVLAHARSQVSKDAQSKPQIILLDEVAAHLDEQRRAALSDAICALQAQTFLTGTDEFNFTALRGRAAFIEVKDGGLHPRYEE